MKKKKIIESHYRHKNVFKYIYINIKSTPLKLNKYVGSENTIYSSFINNTIKNMILSFSIIYLKVTVIKRPPKRENKMLQTTKTNQHFTSKTLLNSHIKASVSHNLTPHLLKLEFFFSSNKHSLTLPSPLSPPAIVFPWRSPGELCRDSFAFPDF